MKNLNQIREIQDLDARIINASALLEFELRNAIALPGNNTLGGLVQKFEPFKTNRFVRDVNFALGVRNAIAHHAPAVDPTQTEKMRAADYLIRAVHMVQVKNGTVESAPIPDRALLPQRAPAILRPPVTQRAPALQRAPLPETAQLAESAQLPEAGRSSPVSAIVSGLNIVVLIVLALAVLSGIGLYETVRHDLQPIQQASPEKEAPIHSEPMPIIRPAKRSRT